MVINVDIKERIIKILNKLRPYLNNDGGDVEFIKYEDGICYVKLTGACAGCMFADMTIKNTIEEILTSEIPEIVEVKNVEENVVQSSPESDMQSELQPKKVSLDEI